MANPEGEVYTAKACNETQTPMVLSSWATSSSEQVGEVAPDIPKVYQVYLSKVPEVNADLWERVKRQGFTALALTTDTQLLGKRLNDVRNQFSLPKPFVMGNYEKYSSQDQEIKSQGGSGLAEFVEQHKNNEIDWTIVRQLKADSGLLVFAKGIMCKEDARIALEAGVDGIYVSNHGAR